MEYQHVLAFLTLAEELHFGRAAQRLFTTQPTLSRSISALETSVGVPLFERTSRRVLLSEAGRAFLGPARAIRQANERARESISQSSAGLTGTVRLASSGPSSLRLVSALTRLVAERFPGVTLELLAASYAGEGLNKILGLSADAAFGRWTTVPEGISSRPIFRDRFVVAVPEGSPYAARDRISFAELTREPFIVLTPRPSSVLHDRLSVLSERHQSALSIRHRAPDSWTALALVEAGVGITLTLTSIRDNYSSPGVRFLELGDELEPTWLSLAWPTRFTNSALLSVLNCAEQSAPGPA